LLIRAGHVVEGVEHFFLCFDFSFKELYVINEENVYATVFFSEGRRCFLANGCNEFVGEGCAGNVQNLEVGAVIVNLISNGVSEMCFSQTHAAV
jgi:hypothetical protein